MGAAKRVRRFANQTKDTVQNDPVCVMVTSKASYLSLGSILSLSCAERERMNKKLAGQWPARERLKRGKFYSSTFIGRITSRLKISPSAEALRAPPRLSTISFMLLIP